MQGRTLILALALLTVPGCLAVTEEDGDVDAAPVEPAQQAKPNNDEEAPEEGALETSGLHAPPQWEIGDWWTVEVSTPLIEDTVTVTRVVTGTEAGDYLVGMPKDAWDERGLILHVPGLGGVRQEDLSFEVHDARFQPVQFPLTNETTWTTAYEGDPVDASVTVNPDGTADIDFCCGPNIQATYDPTIGALSTFNLDEGFISYTVTDHGEGFDRTVTVPHGHDLVFLNGRAAGLLDVASLEPAPPTGEVTLADDYDRVSFMQMAGPLGVVEQPASSHYIERTTAPDGTLFETTNPPTSTGLTLAFYEHEDVGGTWTFEHVAPGPGIAFTEGIGYHVFDVDMPSGTLLTGHEHHDGET